MSKPVQALLVLCDDVAQLQKLAAGIRGMAGVKEVRSGTFSKERVLEHKMGVFFPGNPKGQPPPGIRLEEDRNGN